MSTSLPRTPPTFNADRFTCPQCGWRDAPQLWIVLGVRGPRTFDQETAEWREFQLLQHNDNRFTEDDFGASAWHAAQCGHCHEMSIWHNEVMVYPDRDHVGGPPHADLPKSVRELYAEAAAVTPRSRRAGAALARAAAERMLRHLDDRPGPRATLHKRIESIQDRISVNLIKQLRLVQTIGNSAVHGDDHPNSVVVIALDETSGPELIVTVLLDAVNQLAEELIARPRLIEDYSAGLQVET